ncbi:putative glycoside hydrolase, partial [Candidatus Margulisiibacteriota bacterium]
MFKLRYFLLTILMLSAFAVQAERPENVRGVYVNVWTMNAPAKFYSIVNNSLENGLNAIVCDYEGKSSKAYRQDLAYAKREGLYCIARIVVFTDGVGATFKNVRNPENWSQKQQWAKDCEKLGFSEVQFDYIRFADTGSHTDKKKEVVEEFLTEAKNNLGIPVGIDVFGSVAYQPRHTIGQDLNRLANIVNVVSPMLYPSHFH